MAKSKKNNATSTNLHEEILKVIEGFDLQNDIVVEVLNRVKSEIISKNKFEDEQEKSAF